MTDRAVYDHRRWLGYLQPEGLVVSAAALAAANVFYDRGREISVHDRFRAVVESRGESLPPEVKGGMAGFVRDFLGWPAERVLGLKGNAPVPEDCVVYLPDYQETLVPTLAAVDRAGKPVIFAWALPDGTDLDRAPGERMRGWNASPKVRFERLLRDVGNDLGVGILWNAEELRLIYAPKGENSGSLSFPLRVMTENAGRPMAVALDMLLGAFRLFAARDGQRLPDLLALSRKIQANVSTELSQQVLAALYELLRGFQIADAAVHGDILRQMRKENPNAIYEGLLTVLMRLVFLLYAEDRDFMPRTELYASGYSVRNLFARLRADAEQHYDLMDSRYGAWSGLCSLFYLVYKGCVHREMKLPSRLGGLFQPDRFPFIDGRYDQYLTWGTFPAPLIPDGTVLRVLESLLLLNGERISYRTLDVEQIGSVYETMMGFRLEVAAGQTICLKAKANGETVPTPVNLEEILALRPAERDKRIAELAGIKITGEALRKVKEATNVDALLSALDSRIAKTATPDAVPAGSLLLAPTDERRRSGTEYTPRTLTGPIVERALEPVLMRLGANPAPEELLELAICDPACGSGAFLVEACRQLGDRLAVAWSRHKATPFIPADEDEMLHARRLVAQRCLYGVDRNHLAVDLTKLSLWLATLAKNHPFTFVDHAMRCGDSLVGMSREQLEGFHWRPTENAWFLRKTIFEKLENAGKYRDEILADGDRHHPGWKRSMLRCADDSLESLRIIGDILVAAYFSENSDRKRNEARNRWFELLQDLYGYENERARIPLNTWHSQLYAGPKGIRPFHWELEFPEVFTRNNPGFDCIVGNPPFAGKNTLAAGNRQGYPDWLKEVHPESHGNADLSAHFFRHAFDLLREGGAFGLIATNTISQGDTRATGLRWICGHGGTIYSAKKRYKWPGKAAVVVSVAHVGKAKPKQLPAPVLDNRKVERITAYLFHEGTHEDPKPLRANAGKSFIGNYVLGMGFTFDDQTNDPAANSIADMERLIRKNPANKEVIFPYIGGEEVNNHPQHLHHRHVINFGERSEAECRKRWPELMRIVEKRVKSTRSHLTGNAIGRRRAQFWWQYGSSAKELYDSIRNMNSVFALSRVSQYLAIAKLPTNVVMAETLVVFAFDKYSAYSVLQSRIHEIWAVFFSSSLEDRLRYSPSDCFETFPFPADFETNASLETAGKEYYDCRAALMIEANEGLTKTYNRFHDPNERASGIQRLRDLHLAMDRAVFAAYGWNDLAAAEPECILSYDDAEEDAGEESPSRRRKKPWRLRYPDAVRDDILARLLRLNALRAAAEERLGAEAAANRRGGKKGWRGNSDDGCLFVKDA
jgi:hypothetical protein